MSKKLRFTSMNQEVLANINQILEIQFVQITAVADLNREIKKCELEISDIDKKLTDLEATSDEYIQLSAEKEGYQKQVQRAENRKEGISLYANPLLYGKRGKDGFEGLYQKVFKVAGDSFYGYYTDAIDRQSLNDTKHAMGFKSAMTSLIKETFGMSDSPDALIAKFCNWMTAVNVPLQATTGKKIVKGELIKAVAEKTYYRNLLMVMIDYMTKKGGLDIVVPTVSEYDYEVTYNDASRPVTFKMVLKSEDQKKVEAEAEAQAKAEKKAEAKKRREAKKAENKAA